LASPPPLRIWPFFGTKYSPDRVFSFLPPSCPPFFRGNWRPPFQWIVTPDPISPATRSRLISLSLRFTSCVTLRTLAFLSKPYRVQSPRSWSLSDHRGVSFPSVSNSLEASIFFTSFHGAVFSGGNNVSLVPIFSSDWCGSYSIAVLFFFFLPAWLYFPPFSSISW